MNQSDTLECGAYCEAYGKTTPGGAVQVEQRLTPFFLQFTLRLLSALETEI
jgi:hypothetical protein